MSRGKWAMVIVAACLVVTAAAVRRAGAAPPAPVGCQNEGGQDAKVIPYGL